MTTKKAAKDLLYLDKFTARKVRGEGRALVTEEETADSLAVWMTRYLALAVAGVRSEAVARKIALHLERFRTFFVESYGHERISACLRRDVQAWQTALTEQGLAPATVNNHLASLSAFTTWVHAQEPHLFAVGDPTKGIGELGLPTLGRAHCRRHRCARSRTSATGWSGSISARAAAGRRGVGRGRCRCTRTGGPGAIGPSSTCCCPRGCAGKS
jgi:hypothetical protein